jgi:hypothetical protein
VTGQARLAARPLFRRLRYLGRRFNRLKLLVFWRNNSDRTAAVTAREQQIISDNSATIFLSKRALPIAELALLDAEDLCSL